MLGRVSCELIMRDGLDEDKMRIMSDKSEAEVDYGIMWMLI